MPDTPGKRQRREVKEKRRQARDERRIARLERRDDPTHGTVEELVPLEGPVVHDGSLEDAGETRRDDE